MDADRSGEPTATADAVGRPWVVRAYLVYLAVGLVVGAVWTVDHGRLGLWWGFWTILMTGIAALVIWNASRLGWTLIALWALVSIPFTFTGKSSWIYANVAMQAVSLALLFSLPMLRWIWRDGRQLHDAA